jgi:hypothetical protein
MWTCRRRDAVPCGEAMTKTKSTRNATKPSLAAARVVYVLDAWNDTDQRSVVAVFATRIKAKRALMRLLNKPGDWYAGIVKRTIQ